MGNYGILEENTKNMDCVHSFFGGMGAVGNPSSHRLWADLHSGHLAEKGN